MAEQSVVLEAFRRGLIDADQARSQLKPTDIGLPMPAQEGSGPTPSPVTPKPSYNASMGITERKISGNPIDDPESVLNGASQSIAGILQTVADTVGADKAKEWLTQSITGMQQRQNTLNERGATADVSNMAGKAAPFVALPASAETAAGRIGLGAASNAAMGITKPVAEGEQYDRMNPARIAGDAALGGVTAGAPEFLAAPGRVIQSAANVIVPKVEEGVAKLAQRAKDFDIPLSLNQLAPGKIRNTVQKVSQAAPLSGVQAFEDTQRAAWNKAVAGTLGEDATTLGPSTINSFLERTGKGFDDVLQGKQVNVTPESVKTLDTIAENAKDSLTSDLAGIVQRNVDKFKTDIGDGVISGEKLASFRSELVKRAAKAQGEAKSFLTDIVDHVDDLAESSIGQEGAQQLQSLRRQWRNFKTVEPLLEKSTTGKINPTELQQRVAASPYIKASRKSVGEDDLVDLARIGKQLLPVPGGSDTFEKLGLGAGGMAALTNPMGVGVPLVGGLAANRIFQSFYNQSTKLVESAIAKSLGLRSGEVMKLVKANAPLDEVVSAIQKSGASPQEVNDTIDSLRKFSVQNENPSPASSLPNPKDKMKAHK